MSPAVVATGKRAKQTAACTEAEEDGEESRQGGTDEKRSHEHGEGALGAAEGECFEIAGIARLDMNADADVLSPSSSKSCCPNCRRSPCLVASQETQMLDIAGAT